MKHRVVVCSKGKPDSMKVIPYFRKYGFNDYTVVICNDDDYVGYRANTDGQIAVVPKEVDNLSKKKEWILANLIAKGEWVISIDDNVKRITCVDEDIYNIEEIKAPNREKYNKEISPQVFIEKCEKDIAIASSVGALYGGFASNDNPFFRKKKYRNCGFVWGKVCYMRSAGIKWMNEINEMDDWAYSAINIALIGRVLINNWIYPYPQRNEKSGGTGTLEQRMPHRVTASKMIEHRFKGLVKRIDKVGHEKGAELKMVLTTEKQVAAWKTSRYKK